MCVRLAVFVAVAAGVCPAVVVQGEEPQVLDKHFRLQQVAAAPDLVTPIGLTFDGRGRLLVIESHTHFPPKDYQGPKSDRIRLLEDKNGDGQIDRFHTFHEGLTAAMSLRAGPDNWIYVATRSRIFRLRDTDGDDTADEEFVLARLETPGQYPHNGLGGLALDGQGNLYFGLGENLGADYSLIGADGTTYRGGGEGGNVYRIGLDGTGLTRIATGFWNPFGMCVDPAGRLFAVGNDPDSQPPCRLVQVAMAGDYGFQFRYGRSGRHPLQAWNGELPGTLPMVAGTGEAPSAVIPYAGALWTGSWGDHRVERFRLAPRGASWTSTLETVVQGDENFRPVDFAEGPDGSLYFTDWVDRSYPVHGKGRLWRLSKTEAKPGAEPADAWPGKTKAELQAAKMMSEPDMAALASDDPFLRQAVVAGLVRQPKLLQQIEGLALPDPRQRIGYLQAVRWQAEEQQTPPAKFTSLLQKALQDPSAEVRLMAVRWIADHSLVAMRGEVEGLLKAGPMTPALFQAVLGALEWLDEAKSGLPRNGEYTHYLEKFLADEKRAPALRVMALRLLPAEHAAVSVPELKKLLDNGSPELRRAAVRLLALSDDPQRMAVLAEQAVDASADEALRADAVFGLGRTADTASELLQQLAREDSAAGREAAIAVRLARREPLQAETKPAPEETDRWLELLADPGDAEAGWRVFFDSRRGGCVNCHRYQGQGSDVGPDLTEVGKRLTPQRLLESILQPSREVAPLFVPWVLATDDGKVRAGLSQGVTADGKSERFIGVDGKPFVLLLESIEVRKPSPLSIMPQGLEKALTLEDLRNLKALFAPAP
ncbi:PVC-type heme-binding CxxCH protein [Lignipirellula cremea]|uniref:SMP-30/Gluconolaconase/LRE-like region n=1 Tax=Lignipirellula cremea TaxID=2528010 RepID=A0A518E0S1_9BACT|nr:PVC-type heme-binding CxxCH protein [Lignipirellula cremea]QDU97680.1 SMP-30/Gluconolaconase/LRE-like region [Lignipirellula cremea]